MSSRRLLPALILIALALGPARARSIGVTPAPDSLPAPPPDSVSARPPVPGEPVFIARLDGVIAPGSAEYMTDALKKAEKGDGAALILVLNTPGGLEASMRTMVQAILASTLPVVVYVAPQGARAASAGVFITLAAHVAAMAPGTNVGAAHPVTIGGGPGGGESGDQAKTMTEKMTNDAAAFARSIAQKRGRNLDWAERSVRESISASAEEAVRDRVVDFVAPTEAALLDSLEGRTVTVGESSRTLHVKDHPVVELPMGFRHRVLGMLSDPNVAYIFLMLGFYGLLFELSNPGAILPGIAGGIFIILAFFALQTLPVNYAGLLLILFAMVLFIAELKVTSHGLLAVGGVTSLLLGSLLLFNSPVPYWRLSLNVLLPVVLTTSVAVAIALALSIRTHRKRVTTGREGMVGLRGHVVDAINPPAAGRVQVHGEFWTAESDLAIEPGAEVEVVELSGTLRMRVRKTRG